MFFRKNKSGFTLSEMLVSLSVLGLIAALTIPGLIMSFQESQRKTQGKELFRTVSTLLFEGYSKGELPTTGYGYVTTKTHPLMQYFASHLNYQALCDGSETTGSCELNNDYYPGYAKIILQNGSSISPYHYDPNGWVHLFVEYDGKTGRNFWEWTPASGKNHSDRNVYLFNKYGSDQTYDQRTIKDGQLAPHWGDGSGNYIYDQIHLGIIQ